MEVNGKFYSMWGQLVEGKARYIGGVLEDHDMGTIMTTEITDITLLPNGETSAFFAVKGEHFSCGFDVGTGGVTGGEEGWLTMCGYGGHTWRFKAPA
jgi:hypothetical protein